jgi:hypothetical protein
MSCEALAGILLAFAIVGLAAWRAFGTLQRQRTYGFYTD